MYPQKIREFGIDKVYGIIQEPMQLLKELLQMVKS